MGEVEGDDVAIKTAACELEGSFVGGTESEDVVGRGEGCEAGILVARFGESQGESPQDCKLRGDILLWERIWNGAFLGCVRIW